MFETILTLVAGGLAGFGIAVAIGQEKFRRIQTEARTRYVDLLHELNIERNLNTGLTEELDALATKSK
jgi:hypothetical protein